jgi:hypothetical protein
MTENPSTSSAAKSAKSALLPKNSQDALRVTVELYNEGLPREDQLNWQNVKGIFDTKETSVLADIKSVFTSKEKKERYAQIERDANCVRYYVEIVQACPALDAAVGCTNRIKRLSVGINDWILTKDLSTNK